MKKILIALSVLILIFVACVYIFIPAKINVSVISIIKAPASGVYRNMNTDQAWSKWLKFPGNTLTIKVTGANQFSNAVNVSMFYKNDTINSNIELLRSPNDSMIIQWKFSMPAGNNPLSRFSSYRKAVTLKEKMDSVIQQLKLFASKDQNIYGFSIHESSIKDTFLIATKTKLTHYPETNDLYSSINKLKDYAEKSGAYVTGYPMYNVLQLNKDTQRLMVALPVNKELQKADPLFSVRMVPGKFLVGEVNGGNETVKTALTEMQYYFADHNRTAMAIPFAYLITNRQQETDTSKWITKIYAPVF